MSFWLMVVTIAAPIGLVICVGGHDHLALEFAHEGQHCASPVRLPNTFADNDFNGCSDTPVFSFFGRVRTTILPTLSARDYIRFEEAHCRMKYSHHDAGVNEIEKSQRIRRHTLEALQTSIIIC